MPVPTRAVGIYAVRSPGKAVQHSFRTLHRYRKYRALTESTSVCGCAVKTAVPQHHDSKRGSAVSSPDEGVEHRLSASRSYFKHRARARSTAILGCPIKIALAIAD